MRSWTMHTDSVWTLAASSDFETVFSGGRDGCIYRCSTLTGHVQHFQQCALHGQPFLLSWSRCSLTTAAYGRANDGSLRRVPACRHMQLCQAQG